ncbi:urease accessory protein UreF [Ancylobacter lacus]|uniref:urease accessory protein UreF n=1 Tax=Ancylobacter lacus TaxID=2579970 RepID=UPI001BCD4CBB|nr:urease accessory UreF family protein [Ancylobacter lacus]MBS7540798.1 urease accessory protein UreF [Ancylobacter lacus]
MKTAGLLTALRFGDSAFPGGGFAFSQGLEGLAPLRGATPDADAVAAFLDEQISHRWGPAERVTLVRCHRAAGTGGAAADDDGADTAMDEGALDAVAALDRDLDLSTFSQTLRRGARRNGAAFLAAHLRLGTPGAGAYRGRIASGAAPGTLAAIQGLLWRRAGLDETEAAALAGYQLVAGGLTAATRLGLVGALGAQALMPVLLGRVADVVSRPVAADEEPSGFSPYAEIAAARQARLPLRLFSN